MQVARLTEDVDVVKEPVEEVASSRDYVGELEKLVSVALCNNLYALKLEEWLEEAKELSSLSNSFYGHTYID